MGIRENDLMKLEKMKSNLASKKQGKLKEKEVEKVVEKDNVKVNGVSLMELKEELR